MRVVYHKIFKKNFKKRVALRPKLRLRFYQRLNLLLKEPENPLLRRHRLKGRKKLYWSFSITGDIRVVYRIEKNTIFLYDIGTHAQVY